MYRRALENLIAWKNAERRKPLVVNGVRQVGKTWLVTEFRNNAPMVRLPVSSAPYTEQQLMNQSYDFYFFVQLQHSSF